MERTKPFDLSVRRRSDESEVQTDQARLDVLGDGNITLSFEIGSDRGYFVEICLDSALVRKIGSDLLQVRNPTTTVAADRRKNRHPIGFCIPHQFEAHIKNLENSDGDCSAGLYVEASSGERLLLVSNSGRVFTPKVERLLELIEGKKPLISAAMQHHREEEVVDAIVWKPGEKLLFASKAGDGFVVASDEVLAHTREGKQVMTLGPGVKTALCRKVAGDHVAVVGDNRKLLVFPLADLPEMAKGKGVRLQKYKDGGLSDATTFTLAQGLLWKDPAGRTRLETDLTEWQAARATAGRMAPRGFPRDNRFT